ncbi:hypothetical protein UUU_15900 [Klebsiella pneumoniae subsp. pneumoniae DSM 30104 = JCM 1662 = NBRC 14940]|nr:hypothetical protein UUU_15900 [Klebsiella pneumoniae subsp. pneumoniae DSM 30104 = JCM 1662 = NBRC 14940]
MRDATIFSRPFSLLLKDDRNVTAQDCLLWNDYDVRKF